MKRKYVQLSFVFIGSALVLFFLTSLLVGGDIPGYDDCNCFEPFCLNMVYVQCDMFCTLGKQPGTFCYAVQPKATRCFMEYCELHSVQMYCSDTDSRNWPVSCMAVCPSQCRDHSDL